MGSSNSLSFPSEPPDLGNWFSSYEYESPALNNGDDFKGSGCSVLVEIEDSKKEIKQDFDENSALGKGKALLAGEKVTSNGFLSSKNQARCDNNCASEVFENSDSLSQFSEAPDVRNWFSSYVYESPMLDTCYEVGSEIDEEENHAENSSTQKEVESISTTKAVDLHDLKVQNISSDGLIECTNSFGENENHHHCFAKDSQKACSCRNKGLAVLDALNPQCHSQMQDSSTGSAKDFEIPIINGGSMSESKKQNLPPELLSDPTKEKHKAFANSIDFISPSKKLDLDAVKRRPLNNAAGGDDNKENDRNECAESGFISTRKSKQAEENHNFRKLAKDGAANPPRTNKESIAARKVLLETTNFEAPNVLEITGKWRCPQKSKPNLGPPLKQLRLEQWVRRL